MYFDYKGVWAGGLDAVGYQQWLTLFQAVSDRREGVLREGYGRGNACRQAVDKIR